MEQQITPGTPEPKKQNDLSIPVAIVLAGVMVAGAILYSDLSRPAPLGEGGANIPSRDSAGADENKVDEALLVLRADDHVLGNREAEVVIIEWSDTECPFCKRFHATMLQVMEQYGKTGAVAWVYRHFPLSMHPRANKEAEALECAAEIGGNEGFWKYTDKIFEITPANNGLDPAMLPEIAQMVGLDVARFETCLSSGKYKSRVDSDHENGIAAGVQGTPYSIIWNRKTGVQKSINGALGFEQVKSILGAVSASQGAEQE